MRLVVAASIVLGLVAPAPATAQIFSIVHAFGAKPAPRSPEAPLIEAADGNFYGTTAYGGAADGRIQHGGGTVFRMTPGGTLTILHEFTTEEGFAPSVALLQGTDGAFYGVTPYGGPAGSGG